MSSRAPAIPLFGDAYIADTRHLSLEEHGAYLNLMMIAWRSEDCSLPDDDARLARMLGVTAKKWANLKPVVMDFWSLENGRWSQKRLTKERRFVAKKSEQNAEAANSRWNAKPLKNNEPTNANASPMQSERNAPPPSPPQEGKRTAKAVVISSEMTAPAEPDDLGVKPEHVIEAWNMTAAPIGLPLVKKMTPERRRKLNTFIRRHSIDEITEGISAIGRSPFLRGENPRGWRADFDWMTNPTNFTKLTEGTYDR